MLINGYYIEEVRGVFGFIPEEILKEKLGANAVELFKRKNIDFKIDVFMDFKEKYISEKNQDYYNALSLVLSSKYQTKKYVHGLIKHNAELCVYGNEEEKKISFFENMKLLDLEKYVLI